MNINYPLFESVIYPKQPELKKRLIKILQQKGYKKITNADGYLFAKGVLPVLLVAHMDTVHKKPVSSIFYTWDTLTATALEGIGGDDRCGIYMILKIVEELKCSVLFTEDEEIGGVGARKFTANLPKNMPQINWIIEFDRTNANDAVFYYCGNKEFQNMVTSYDFNLNYGSYSDIVDIAPALEVAAVNLSCGYYNAHTDREYIKIDEMEKQIDRAKKLIAENYNTKYKWVEDKSYWGYGYRGSWYDKWDSWEDAYPEDVWLLPLEYLHGITVKAIDDADGKKVDIPAEDYQFFAIDENYRLYYRNGSYSAEESGYGARLYEGKEEISLLKFMDNFEMFYLEQCQEEPEEIEIKEA